MNVLAALSDEDLSALWHQAATDVDPRAGSPKQRRRVRMNIEPSRQAQRRRRFLELAMAALEERYAGVRS